LKQRQAGHRHLKARMISAFPAFGGHALLDHEMRFLFPHKEAKA
jgi:hypothetical protein